MGKKHLCYVTDNENLYCIKAKDKFNSRGHRKEKNANVYPILSHVIKVSSGNNFSCAMDKRHDLYCIGNNSFGQLGNGATKKSGIAVKVLSNIIDFSASKNYACAINNENKLYCWGRADKNNLGISNSKSKKIVSLPQKVNVEEVQNVSCGIRVACTISLKGEVYCWGNLKKNKLQDNEDIIINPTKISSIKDIQDIAISSSRIYFLTNKKELYFVPIKRLNKKNADNEIKILPRHMKFLDIKNIDKFFSNSRQVCVINKRGQALCMGNNRYGQLGNFKKKKYNTPMLFVKDKKIKEITIGTYDICVVTNKNKIICKGKNQYLEY